MRSFTRLSRLALLAFGQTASLCDAQTADYSEATIERLKPLYEEAQAADAQKNHPTAFRVYLRMWDLSHIPETRYLAISNAFKCIDFGRVEQGLPLTKDEKFVAERCPEPLSASDKDIGAQHLMFAFIQMALLTHANNTKDFDTAAELLARAEVHLDESESKGLDDSMKPIAGQVRSIFVDAKKTITYNKGVENYYSVLNGVRRLFRAGESTASTSRPAAPVTRAPASLDRYRNCRVISDALASSKPLAKGVNALRFHDAATNNTWTVTYRFGSSGNGYLMNGSGSLSGRTVNVRFDDGQPTSLSSASGSGACKVIEATKSR